MPIAGLPFIVLLIKALLTTGLLTTGLGLASTGLLTATRVGLGSRVSGVLAASCSAATPATAPGLLALVARTGLPAPDDDESSDGLVVLIGRTGAGLRVVLVVGRTGLRVLVRPVLSHSPCRGEPASAAAAADVGRGRSGDVAAYSVPVSACDNVCVTRTGDSNSDCEA